MNPVYYKFDGDGFNNWKVIVKLGENKFVGTTRVYRNGMTLDPIATSLSNEDVSKMEILTLDAAVELTKSS